MGDLSLATHLSFGSRVQFRYHQTFLPLFLSHTHNLILLEFVRHDLLLAEGLVGLHRTDSSGLAGRLRSTAHILLLLVGYHAAVAYATTGGCGAKSEFASTHTSMELFLLYLIHTTWNNSFHMSDERGRREWTGEASGRGSSLYGVDYVASLGGNNKNSFHLGGFGHKCLNSHLDWNGACFQTNTWT